MNILTYENTKIVNQNNRKFLKLFANTTKNSNNGYRGEGEIHLYQLDHRHGTKNFSRPFRNWDPTYLDQHINLYCENWFTVNSVKGINRSSAVPVGYNALYVDIDVLKEYLKHHKGVVVTSKLRKRVLFNTFSQLGKLIHSRIIINPTAMIMSGNGFHLYWLFNHQMTDHSKHISKNDVPASEWNDIEQFIFKQVSKYIPGCDHSATDSKRILRMPRSNNTKKYAQTGDLMDLEPVQCWYFSGVRHSVKFYLSKYHQYEKAVEKKHNTNKSVKYKKGTKYSHRALALLHFADSLYTAAGLFNNDGRRENILFYYASLIMHSNAYSVKHHFVSAKSVKDDVNRCIRIMNKRFGHNGTRLPDDEVNATIIHRVNISKFNTYNKKKDHKNHDLARYVFTKAEILKGCKFTEKEQVYLRYLRSNKVEMACSRANRYNMQKLHKWSNAKKAKKQFMFKMSLANKALYLHNSKHLSYRKIIKIINQTIVNKIMSKHSHHYTAKQLRSMQISLSTLRRLMKQFSRIITKFRLQTKLYNQNELRILGQMYVNHLTENGHMVGLRNKLIKQANSWDHRNPALATEQIQSIKQLAQIA